MSARERGDRAFGHHRQEVRTIVGVGVHVGHDALRIHTLARDPAGPEFVLERRGAEHTIRPCARHGDPGFAATTCRRDADDGIPRSRVRELGVGELRGQPEN